MYSILSNKDVCILLDGFFSVRQKFDFLSKTRNEKVSIYIYCWVRFGQKIERFFSVKKRVRLFFFSKEKLNFLSKTRKKLYPIKRFHPSSTILTRASSIKLEKTVIIQRKAKMTNTERTPHRA